MSINLGYARKFIILRNEYTNMEGLNPKGHGKLEVKGSKGSIFLTIENGEPNNFYNVGLISRNGFYELGKIYTNENGNSKVELNLNYRELGEMGFSMERINGILILRDLNILLGGYFNQEDSTIERFIKSLENEEIEEENLIEEVYESPVEQEVYDTPIEEPIEEVIQIPEEEPIEEMEEEEAIEEVEAMEDEILEVEEVEEIPFNKELFEKDLINIFSIEEEIKEEETLEPIDYEYLEEHRKIARKKQTTNYILNILSFFPYIEPFKNELKGYNWWKIDVEDPTTDSGFLPYYSYIAGGNQKQSLVENSITSNELIKNHKHYLFGLYNINDKVKFYVYAVAGKFLIEEHPQRGATGFNTWYEKSEGDGYWLLFIDPLTGDIVYPINPMVPTS